MVFSKGFIFRWGQRIKEFGERMGGVRLFGVPMFRWCADPVIGFGRRIKNSVLRCSIGEM
jgi:hypothetical protein